MSDSDRWSLSSRIHFIRIPIKCIYTYCIVGSIYFIKRFYSYQTPHCGLEHYLAEVYSSDKSKPSIAALVSACALTFFRKRANKRTNERTNERRKERIQLRHLEYFSREEYCGGSRTTRSQWNSGVLTPAGYKKSKSYHAHFVTQT